MNEYKAISSCDNLLIDKTYVGYDDGNTVTLTHVLSGDRVVQLYNPIKTIYNNVKLINTNKKIGLNFNAKPYPRKRDHIKYI